MASCPPPPPPPGPPPPPAGPPPPPAGPPPPGGPLPTKPGVTKIKLTKKKRAPLPPPKPKVSPWDCPNDVLIGPWINNNTRFAEADLSSPDWLERIVKADDSIRCVLVDFFAYSCTNCVRTIASIQALHAQYGPHGLLVVGLHRPEFDFERDRDNLSAFLQKKGVSYLVGMDNEDAGWNAWEVAFWPTHYLVERDPKDEGKTKLRKVYHDGNPALFIGDIPENHHALDVLIAKRTAQAAPPAAPPVPPHPLDMEIFLGKEHQFKNVSSGASCGDGACIIQMKPGTAKAELKPEQQPRTEGFTIYGAAWCRFCRAAKLLLSRLELDFLYVDVEELGGAAATIAALGIDRSSIPIVYKDGALVGGFDDVVTSLVPDAELVERCVEESRSQSLLFDRDGNTATVSIGHGWGVQHERAIARTQNATIDIQFAFSSGGSELMTVYVVGGPDVHGEPGGTSFNVKQDDQEVKIISTPQADRHFVARAANGGSLSLSFDIGFCLYVVYVTSETPS